MSGNLDPGIPPRPEDAAQVPELGPARLAVAVHELSALAEARWVQIADRILSTALSAPRRSLPIRARAASGPVWVSEHALTTLIHAAVDGVLERCALKAVQVHVRDRDVLEEITLVMVAQYGRPLLPMADLARELTLRVLRETLGPVTPEITVAALWVHFDDVIVGDPNYEAE